MNSPANPLGTGRTQWKIEDYLEDLKRTGRAREDGRRDEFEAALATRFPPIAEEIIYESAPCIVIDSCGQILVWYLPRAIRKPRSVRLEPRCKHQALLTCQFTGIHVELPKFN